MKFYCLNFVNDDALPALPLHTVMNDDAFIATSCYFCFLNWVILIFLLFDNVIDIICNIIVGFVCGLFMMVLVLVLVMVSGVKFFGSDRWWCVWCTDMVGSSLWMEVLGQ